MEANSSSIPRDPDAKPATAAGFSIQAHCSSGFVATHQVRLRAAPHAAYLLQCPQHGGLW
jgi:hypothetical protein